MKKTWYVVFILILVNLILYYNSILNHQLAKVFIFLYFLEVIIYEIYFKNRSDLKWSLRILRSAFIALLFLSIKGSFSKIQTIGCLSGAFLYGFYIIYLEQTQKKD